MARLRQPIALRLPFEFVVLGKPFSAQNKTAGYVRWRERIAQSLLEQVEDRSDQRGFALSSEKLRAQIVWLSAQPDAIDLPDPANIVKPLLDTLEGMIIEDDKQVRRVEVVRIDLNKDGMLLPTIVEEIQDDPLLLNRGELVYVRVDLLISPDGPEWDWWK